MTDNEGLPRRRPATAMTRARLLKLLDKAFDAGYGFQHDEPDATIKEFDEARERITAYIAGDFGK